MSQTYEFIHVEEAGAVATITFDRPEVRNALHLPMNLEIRAALKALVARGQAQLGQPFAQRAPRARGIGIAAFVDEPLHQPPAGLLEDFLLRGRWLQHTVHRILLCRIIFRTQHPCRDPQRCG